MPLLNYVFKAADTKLYKATAADLYKTAATKFFQIFLMHSSNVKKTVKSFSILKIRFKTNKYK